MKKIIKRHRKKIIVIAVIIIVVIIVGVIASKVFVGKKNGEKTIKKENTNKQNSNSIDNASDSVEDTGKWEKINRFELKSAPVAYLKIEPSGDMVEIYSPDDNNGYCRVDKSYYKIPTEVYDYIMSKIK